MKLYPTPPYILTLGAHPPWLGYSARKLAFGQIGTQAGRRASGPRPNLILQCAALLADGGYVQLRQTRIFFD